MTTPTIVFDLDGTLADTAADLINTLNFILGKEGIAPLPLERARDLIGAGARALIGRGFATAGQHLTPDRHEALFQLFLEHYEHHLAEESALFPGVEQALDDLAAAGCRLAVCTNKMENHSLLLLEALGVRRRFAAICGRDTFDFYKPDPRALTETVRRAGGDPSRALMVGDSKTDIDTAKAAGIPVIAVPFGYTDIPVHDLSPDAVIEHFDALKAAIQHLRVI